ncbi:MAG: PP2C family serine/threonine-protein phosphatase [bacterium]
MMRIVAGEEISAGGKTWTIDEIVAGKENEAWCVRATQEGVPTWLWIGGPAWADDVRDMYGAVQDARLPKLLDIVEGDHDVVLEVSGPPKGYRPFNDQAWWALDRQAAVEALRKLTRLMGKLHDARVWLQGIKRRELYIGPNAELFVVSLGRLHMTRKPPIEAAWRDMRVIGELAYEVFADEPYPGGHQMAAILQDKSAMEGTPILFPGLPQLLAGCVSPYGDLAYVDTRDLLDGLEQLRVELDRPLTIEVGSASTVGNYLFRKNNQDSCGHLLAQSICGSRKVSLGFFCVADGIGGIQDGERASRVAVETATQSFARAWAHYGASYMAENVPELARSIAKVVGQRLAVEGELRPNNNRGGTTFSGMVICDDRLGVCHVGDSRIVLFRDDTITALTHDHTLANILIELGELTPEEAAKNDVSQRTISRFLSTSAEVELDRVDGFGREAAGLPGVAETNELKVRRGDLYILTSDGAHGEIDDEGLLVLARRLHETPQALADALVKNAVDRMGRDNATALVVRID